MRVCKILGGGECHGLIVCASMTITGELNEDQAC